MKKLIRNFVQRCTSISFEQLQHAPLKTQTEIAKIVQQDSANFVLNHIENAMVFQNEFQMREFAIKKMKNSGEFAEFGVWKGASFREFFRYMQKYRPDNLPELNAFDSFNGLSEDWIGTFRLAGHFGLEGNVPNLPVNTKVYKGNILDTLDEFVINYKKANKKLSFIHIDTDTYMPANHILMCCKPILTSGALILFDDFLNHPGWRNNEYKALRDNFDDNEYDYIGFANSECLIKIK